MKKKDFKTKLFQDKRTVYRLNDIALLLGETSLSDLKQRLNYYKRTGVIKNPRRGLYTKDEFNSEELACNINVPAYISLEYVLQKTGIIFQYSEAITVVSYLSREIEVAGHAIHFRKIKNELLVNNEGIVYKDGVNIATPERALLDTLYLNKDFYFDNLNLIDIKKIKHLVKVYDSKRLAKTIERLFAK